MNKTQVLHEVGHEAIGIKSGGGEALPVFESKTTTTIIRNFPTGELGIDWDIPVLGEEHFEMMPGLHVLGREYKGTGKTGRIYIPITDDLILMQTLHPLLPE